MKKWTLFVAVLGMCALLNSPLYAGEMGECPFKGHQQMKSHSQEAQCPIANKVIKKAHFLLEKKADLNLSDEQVKTIKDLKLQAEKDSTQQDASMKVFMLDLNAKLQEEKVDADGIKALIDKDFAAFATAAKANVDTYAKLKSVLNPDQEAKLKEIWKSKKEETPAKS